MIAGQDQSPAGGRASTGHARRAFGDLPSATLALGNVLLALSLLLGIASTAGERSEQAAAAPARQAMLVR
jgi:hypothetical protein